MRRLFPRLADALFGNEISSSADPDADPEPANVGWSEGHRRGTEPRSAQPESRHPAGAEDEGGTEQRVTIDDLRARSPIVREMPDFDGGTQGMPPLSLQRDEDGDEAHEFIVIDAPLAQPASSPAKLEGG